MDHDTEWNVDEYKTPSESEEQWNLRKNFMLEWKHLIPEDRLVCLARVFANIEFLGCRYPDAVMKQVAQLSKEVAHEFREKKKLRISRTFVSAKDAAGDKVRNSKRPPQRGDASQPDSKMMKFVSSESSYASITGGRNNQTCTTLANHPNRRPRQTVNLHTKYGKLILRDRPTGSSASKINDSCQASKIKFNWTNEKVKDEWRCSCIINDILVHSACGANQKLAKENTADEAWNILKKQCFTVLTLQGHISKDDKKISSKEIEGESTFKSVLDTKVESAVASRMMKLMGWKGGALGVSGDGIDEPIAPNFKHISREGLGSTGKGNQNFKSAIQKIIIDFKMLDTADYDLVFANDFTKEERADMHKLALRQGLKSKSFGQDSDRYLVISKQQTLEQIVHLLLECGGSNEKYQLFHPNT